MDKAFLDMEMNYSWALGLLHYTWRWEGDIFGS
jgi:hypothetical protein